MTFSSLNQPIYSPPLQKIVELIHLKKFKEAEEKLEKGVAESKKNKDPVLEACIYSIWGMLCRLKQENKTAWRYYEKAEKLLPENPSLKLISARLLSEVFNQYETAIKKCEKVLKLANKSRPLCHQAQSLLGWIYLKKGNSKKALKFLEEAMEDNFSRMISAQNIDFKLIEALLRKKIGFKECRNYLEKALQFAEKMKEPKEVEKIRQVLVHFPTVSSP